MPDSQPVKSRTRSKPASKPKTSFKKRSNPKRRVNKKQRGEPPQNKNYFKRKSEEIAKKFINFKNNARSKMVIPPKYKNYLKEAKFNVTRPQLKVLAILPLIILSMLVIASKNKQGLKPFTDTVKSYLERSNQTAFADHTFKHKIFLVISILTGVLQGLDTLTLLYFSFTVFNILVYELPGILERLDKTPDIPILTIVKDILRTLVELRPTVVDMPKKYN